MEEKQSDENQNVSDNKSDQDEQESDKDSDLSIDFAQLAISRTQSKETSKPRDDTS